MKQYLVIDVETRIDKTLLNKSQYAGQALTDDQAYARYREQLHNESQGQREFFPVLFHIPISIAAAVVDDAYQLVSVATLAQTDLPTLLDDPVHAEWRMVEEFWRLVGEGYTLVTFNGRRFDLPVLEIAALRYGIQSKKYWNEKYGHRYPYSDTDHYDLHHVLANVGAVHLRGGLHVLTTMLGYQGKGDLDGSQVQRYYDEGRLAEIHEYCRADVLRTYMLFLRLELVRGRMTAGEYAGAVTAAKPWLKDIRQG